MSAFCNLPRRQRATIEIKMKSFLATLAAATLMLISSLAEAREMSGREADARAERTLAQMTLDERFLILRGYVPFLMTPPPQNVAMAAGYVPGIERLGIPPLTETDASLGVANQGGVMRGPDVATALPSGAAMASTWDADLIERASAAIGAEARAKSFNVLLAGGVNLVREPRNGETSNILAKIRCWRARSPVTRSAAFNRTTSFLRSSTTFSTRRKLGEACSRPISTKRRCAKAICSPFRSPLR